MVEINKDDYYSNMYDIENLTTLSKKAKTVNKKVIEIENYIVNNNCLEAKKESISNFHDESQHEINILAGALEVKEILFRSFFNDSKNHLLKSPKECALSELQKYLNKSKKAVVKKMLVEVPVAESWKEINPNPSNKEEVDNFYMITDSYIYELMAANHIVQTLYSFYVLTQKLRDLNITNMLDYGGGAGTLSILFSELGYDVTYADLPGKTFDFAKWRFSNRSLKIPLINLKKEEISSYDCIICTEVFEHLVNPLSLLKKFKSNLKKNQFLVISESCEYVEDFCSHLDDNKKYGGEKFIELLKDYGFEQILNEPFIPQLIFKKII